MIAVSAKEEWEYVLEVDRGTDKPTVFRLKQLTLRARIEAEDILKGGAKGMSFGSFKMRVLKAGLAGWRDLRDASGAEIKPKYAHDGSIGDESMARIPTDAMAEIAWEVFNQSSISETERKN